MASTAAPSEAPSRQVERDDGRGELAQPIDAQRRALLLEGGDRRQRHLLAAGRARQIEVVERVEARGHLRLDLVDHAVLVRLGVDGRDDALAEGVVQQVVDRRRGDAEARRRVAVDADEHRQALVLQLGGDVGDLRDLRHAVHQARHPGVEVVGIGALQHELVLGAADRRIDRQVLRRLHVEGDALERPGLALQAADDLARGRAALVARLEVDQHAAGVERRVGAVDADERGQALDRRDRSG